MRSIFTRSFLGAALSALIAASIASSWTTDAQAQAAFFPKKVQLVWQRLNAASDNPFGSLTPPVPYATQLANGNHNAANLGVAVGVEDTSQAIFIGDHWLKSVPAFRTMPVVASALLADSSWLGTLALRTNSSTIDTVTYFIDHSVDGNVWTVRDSLQGHVISDRLALTLGAVSDSGRVALASLSGASGATSTGAGLSFTANPWFGPGGVTAQSIVGINYIRVRVHMTPGDFAAAGAARGIFADFIYPAVDGNPSRGDRFNP